MKVTGVFQALRVMVCDAGLTVAAPLSLLAGVMPTLWAGGLSRTTV